jgi:general secretion pathway protein A
MYLSFYALRELPFELTPNPRFLFTTPHHQEALSNLQFGLSTGKPLTMLVGEAGTGKTTLLRTALQSDLCRHVKTIYINNPALKRDEFIELLARNFRLSSDAAHSKAAMLGELELVLSELRRRGELIALVVDEAQALSDELLEEIRLLANIETDEQKLLPLVLAGQPELANRLNQAHLRQLKQRISLRCELQPLDLSDTAAYVATRIRAAGGEPLKLFSREAISLIHERSRGIPRTISVICDNTLLSGFALGVQPVTSTIVAEVCRDFDLSDPNAQQRLRPITQKRDGQPVKPDRTNFVVASQRTEPSAEAERGLVRQFVPLPLRHPGETALTRLRSSLFGR